MLAYWGGLTADEIARRVERPARDRQEPHPPRPRASCAPSSSRLGPAGRLARPEPVACRRVGSRRCRSASSHDRPAARLPRRARGLGDGTTGSTPTPTSGQNDPDGARPPRRRSSRGLDAAGHHRALLFAMHEPDGYAAANDAVLARRRGLRAAASWPSRRIEPNADDALAEARRCLEAGARGFKLHPRSDAFGLPHPVVEEVVALAHERRAPVLFHAGPRDPAPRRGGGRPRAPLPGRAPDPRPRRHQRPRLDRRRGRPRCRTSSSTPPGGTSPTSSQLYATIPPGRILYASDMPYAPGPARRLRLPARGARRSAWARGAALDRRRAAGARRGRRGPARPRARRRAPTPWAGA